jgi:tRNA threonylcarbamoyladenosine biosynthesis protein TsaB
MNILAFDATFGAVSVAVGRDMGKPTREVARGFELRQKGHAEALMPLMSRTMAEVGLAFDALDRIALTLGPGTFTGTRIGVAAGRALKLTTRAELVGLSSLAVMAADVYSRLGAERVGRQVLIAVDVRRGEVYAQLFGSGALDAETAPMRLAVEAAARLGSGALIVAGSGAEAVGAAAQGLGRAVEVWHVPLEPDAAALLELAPELAPLDGAPRPLYLRPPDAKPQEGLSIARVT